MTFNLFAPPKAWEYEALKTDIAKRGVLVPIVIDRESGEVIDGHTRQKICDELGIGCPIIERDYTSEEERQLESIVLNIYRRQIAPTRRNTLLEIANQLRMDLGYGDEPIVPPTKTKQPSASDAPEAVAARQRDHRLEERIRPNRRLSPNADPWIVANHALDLLDTLRDNVADWKLREIAELVKQLAWGPE